MDAAKATAGRGIEARAAWIRTPLPMAYLGGPPKEIAEGIRGPTS
jgi:hypothetical protein